jgi:DNA-binding MurR/RpiR family transcriptional regulator
VAQLARQAGAAIVCVTRFIKSPLTAYADLTLLCGANESPLQAGSSSAEISQLFLIDMLYTEYYRTYYDKCSINNEKTSASVMAKLC